MNRHYINQFNIGDRAVYHNSFDTIVGEVIFIDHASCWLIIENSESINGPMFAGQVLRDDLAKERKIPTKYIGQRYFWAYDCELKKLPKQNNKRGFEWL